MLTLSLLLSVAAGVNAIAGGEVKAVKISNNTFICVDGCFFRDTFLSTSGYFCYANETVVEIFNKNGEVNKWYGSGHKCAGDKLEPGTSTRKPAEGDDPWKCNVSKLKPGDFLDCTSLRNEVGGPNKTEEWSYIEKELKATTENKTAPEEVKPATETKPCPEEVKPATETKPCPEEVKPATETKPAPGEIQPRTEKKPPTQAPWYQCSEAIQKMHADCMKAGKKSAGKKKCGLTSRAAMVKNCLSGL